MEKYDWSKFTTRIAIKAAPQALFDAWSSQQGLEYWFLRSAVFTDMQGKVRSRDEAVQAGDTYEWKWEGWDDETKERGKIMEQNGRDHIKFTFGEAGICTVDIKSEVPYTIVELTQSEIPTDEKGMQSYHLGCMTGWTFHLTNMKSIFEGGADLRNKDVMLRNVINA